jgi:tRNA(fMet)-specific endonuclease VapC
MPPLELSVLPNGIQLLFDTNILVYGVRGNATWQAIKALCDPPMREPRPQISIVTEGELRSLIEQFGWDTIKRSQGMFLLSYFARMDINSENILDTYAKIDVYSKQTGYTMGKNDLWVAATASATGAVLVTTDGDFDHLDGVFLTRVRITPV